MNFLLCVQWCYVLTMKTFGKIFVMFFAEIFKRKKRLQNLLSPWAFWAFWWRSTCWIWLSYTFYWAGWFCVAVWWFFAFFCNKLTHKIYNGRTHQPLYWEYKTVSRYYDNVVYSNSYSWISLLSYNFLRIWYNIDFNHFNNTKSAIFYSSFFVILDVFTMSLFH